MKKLFSEVKFANLVRWWLTGILIFLPFQRNIVKSIVLWNNELSAFIGYLDEITIVIFLPLAIREFYKDREILNRLYFILLFPLFFLSVSGFVSGLVNGNPLFITIFGIFDYIKNFLVIFIYAAFFRDFYKLKKIFRLLLLVAVFLGAVALIQELWATASRYILEKDIYDKGIYFLRNIPSGKGHGYFEDIWRFGIYRTSSLMHHPNILGLYCLLILTIYLCMVKKVNFAVLISLFTGVFVSVSRMVYMGFVFIIGLQIFRYRKWLIALVVIPVVIILFFMSSFSDFDIWEQKSMPGLIKLEGPESFWVVSYRVYAREKAMEVWKDHPSWGVGPGMFGGVVSVIFKSPVYEEYDFIATWVLEKYRSLDQFWPQVLAEMGIIGAVGFAGLFISLFVIFYIARQQAASDEVKELFTGLTIFTIVILIYCLGLGLNITSILFTFSAIAGMGLGCSDKQG